GDGLPADGRAGMLPLDGRAVDHERRWEWRGVGILAWALERHSASEELNLIRLAEYPFLPPAGIRPCGDEADDRRLLLTRGAIRLLHPRGDVRVRGVHPDPLA